jgi:hypothetical protein
MAAGQDPPGHDLSHSAKAALEVVIGRYRRRIRSDPL